VPAIEAGAHLSAHGLLDPPRNERKLHGIRFQEDPQPKDRLTLRRTAEIAAAALQRVGIRQDDLLDCARVLADLQAVADDERLVEGNRQRSEEITKYVLQGKLGRRSR